MSTLRQTASQTAGPYVHIGLAPGQAGFDIYANELGHVIAAPDVPGQRIVVEGHVFDGEGELVKDALLEVWQADAAGNYAKMAGDDGSGRKFRGWGRAPTDFTTGLWQIHTIKPGCVRGGTEQSQAPHLNIWIVARGMNIGLNTRIYFDDEYDANRVDPILGSLSDVARRETLIAKRDDAGDLPVYRFDIRLQGDGETVFFDV